MSELTEFVGNMADEDFWKWVSEWYDEGLLMDTIGNWDEDTQKKELEALKKRFPPRVDDILDTEVICGVDILELVCKKAREGGHYDAKDTIRTALKGAYDEIMAKEDKAYGKS